MTTIHSTNDLPMGICVLVDGGCLNNNRPVSERHMYGTLTVFCDRKQVPSTWEIVVDAPAVKQLSHRFELGVQEGHASNNLGELMMINYALSYIFALVQRPTKTGRKIESVTILSDSEWALGISSGEMRLSKKAHQATKNEVFAIDALTGEISSKFGCNITFQHVDNLWVKSVLGH